MGDLQSRFPLQLKTHHYPKICGFRHGGLQRWWIQTLFGWIEGWPAHGKWFDSTKNAVSKFWDLGKITMKSPLLISLFWKKWHGNPDDWEIVGNFPNEKLDPSPWTIFHLMLKERWAPFDWSTRKTGIPWLWRRWWSGMVIEFPHRKALCFSMFFPLIKR